MLYANAMTCMSGALLCLASPPTGLNLDHARIPEIQKMVRWPLTCSFMGSHCFFDGKAAMAAIRTCRRSAPACTWCSAHHGCLHAMPCNILMACPCLDASASFAERHVMPLPCLPVSAACDANPCAFTPPMPHLHACNHAALHGSCHRVPCSPAPPAPALPSCRQVYNTLVPLVVAVDKPISLSLFTQKCCDVLLPVRPCFFCSICSAAVAGVARKCGDVLLPVTKCCKCCPAAPILPAPWQAWPEVLRRAAGGGALLLFSLRIGCCGTSAQAAKLLCSFACDWLVWSAAHGQAHCSEGVCIMLLPGRQGGLLCLPGYPLQRTAAQQPRGWVPCCSFKLADMQDWWETHAANVAPHGILPCNRCCGAGAGAAAGPE